MESVKFWYTFEDENKNLANLDFDMTVSKEDGLELEDVCETFIRFLEAVGYSPTKAREYFPKEMPWD